jgi:hypothetical protein
MGLACVISPFILAQLSTVASIGIEFRVIRDELRQVPHWHTLLTASFLQFTCEERVVSGRAYLLMRCLRLGLQKHGKYCCAIMRLHFSSLPEYQPCERLQLLNDIGAGYRDIIYVECYHPMQIRTLQCGMRKK